MVVGRRRGKRGAARRRHRRPTHPPSDTDRPGPNFILYPNGPSYPDLANSAAYRRLSGSVRRRAAASSDLVSDSSTRTSAASYRCCA